MLMKEKQFEQKNCSGSKNVLSWLTTTTTTLIMIMVIIIIVIIKIIIIIIVIIMRRSWKGIKT